MPGVAETFSEALGNKRQGRHATQGLRPQRIDLEGGHGFDWKRLKMAVQHQNHVAESTVAVQACLAGLRDPGRFGVAGGCERLDGLWAGG